MEEVVCGATDTVADSVEQGFWKPQGYMGKGMEGRGQGMEYLTPRKPSPLSEGRGIPSVLTHG